MSQKIIFFSLVLAGVLFLSGCGEKAGQSDQINQSTAPTANTAENNMATGTSVVADNQSETATALNTCQVENVSLSNYGDPGHRLLNCFVEYPGEPTRQDKNYYIVEDICGQFTQSFMENMLGRKITKIEPSNISTVNACTYYIGDKENILLNLEYLPIENQKKGSEAMGRKTEKSDRISMDNLVVWQDENLINTIYLALGPNKFLSLRPSSKNTINKESFIKLAANIATAIKDYK